MRDMDEVVVSSEDVEVETESETEKEMESGAEGKIKKDGLVKWERFLPRMVLRVLLVEADDSTRQIISALLRKCSYKVVAVPDGLKAWEILKGRPHNIDLILTEVDLPSISGYPLLTLIMEHKICKNIPVIMMSSQDSISTVYKCMLRGAADYLVKPIRRNELRNLWQHVWRRQSSIVGGNGPQDESVGQQKLEFTSENNAASNQSSGFIACIQRNKEQIEKGSDAQSSCTKPDLEAESGDMEIMQDFSWLKWSKSLPNDIKILKHKESPDFCQELPVHETKAGGSVVGACKDANKTFVNEDVEPESQRRDADITGVCNALANSSREAIDFMGAFSAHNSTSDNGTSKFYSPQLLDLSLRRSHPSAFENHVSEERPILRHSSASAFSRYTNRQMQTRCSTSPNYEKNLSEIVAGYNSNAPGPPSIGPPSIQRSTITSLAVGQSDIQPKLSELAISWAQQRVFPVPVPVKDIRVNNLNTGYGSGITPIFGQQTTSSPTLSPSSASQQELTSRANPFQQSSFANNKFEQLYDRLVQNANSANQTMYKVDHKLDSLEDRGHISASTDQSGSVSFCNGAMNHLNSIGYGSTCGSNSNVDQVAVVRAVSESRNEDGFLTPGGNSHRSIQREAALTKFRLKRKDRCFEKKVRYESRKKLAEQRPRVKGQFVRQVQTEPASAVAANHHGNSSDS